MCNAIFGAGNNCLSTKVTGGLLGGAQGQSYSLGEFSNVLILTPTVNGQTCTAGGCPEQEFFEVVPEGGAALAYLLLAGICCFGAVILRSRQTRRFPLPSYEQSPFPIFNTKGVPNLARLCL